MSKPRAPEDRKQDKIDTLFAQFCLDGNLVTKKDIDECLALRKRNKALWGLVSLQDLLIDLGYLSKAQVEQVINRHENEALGCVDCSAIFRVKAPEPESERTYRCKRCGGELEQVFLDRRSGLEKAREFLEERSLPFPPIPPDLAVQLQQYGRSTFATGPFKYSPYDILQWFPPGEFERYALISIAGHGVNSWALHFFLIRGPIWLLLQLAWGGVYSDAARDREEIRSAFAGAARLIEAVEAGLPLPRASVFVEVSSFYGSTWTILGVTRPEGKFLAGDHEILDEALAEFQARMQHSDMPGPSDDPR